MNTRMFADNMSEMVPFPLIACLKYYLYISELTVLIFASGLKKRVTLLVTGPVENTSNLISYEIDLGKICSQQPTLATGLLGAPERCAARI